jgi:hypothetical protein
VVRLNPHAGFCPPRTDLEKFYAIMSGKQVLRSKKLHNLFHEALILSGLFFRGIFCKHTIQALLQAVLLLQTRFH